MTALDVADEYYIASHGRLFRLDVGPWSVFAQPSAGLGDAADDGEVDVDGLAATIDAGTGRSTT